MSALKVERYADNGELSHYELIDEKTGAVLWLSGEPEETGRYFVIYKQGQIIKPFVADYDAQDERWLSMLNDVEILWWKEIPPYCI